MFTIPKAFCLFLWRWEKSEMYSVTEADSFSRKNRGYFNGAIEQLDISS